MVESTPPGWYADPSDHGVWRYWNGSEWTTNTAPRGHGGVAAGPPPPLAPTRPPPQSRPAAAAGGDPARSSGKTSPLGRFLGRKTTAEALAEGEFNSLLNEMVAGHVDLVGLGDRLQAAARSAGLRTRKAASLQEQAFRGLAERLLADDVLTEHEEREFLRVAAALGYDQGTLDSRFADVMQHLWVARINDGRLPLVASPRTITKRGEVVHLETQAALMKEVVHREYRGGGSGISVPIGLGMRFSTGGFRGRSVVVGTSLQPADTGTLTITSRRILYHGQRKAQESRLDRLVAIEAFSDGVRIAVSNRQNASLYRVPSGPVVAAMINAALQRLSDDVG